MYKYEIILYWSQEDEAYGMQLMEKLKNYLAQLLHADVESMTGLEVMEAIAQIWNEL